MTYDITSPTPFTGMIGPVQFVQGKATTDHPSVVAYCRHHGYTVTEAEKPARTRKGVGADGD